MVIRFTGSYIVRNVMCVSHRSDDDMQSIASLMSVEHGLSDIANMDDIDEDDDEGWGNSLTSQDGKNAHATALSNLAAEIGDFAMMTKPKTESGKLWIQLSSRYCIWGNLVLFGG